MTIQERLHVILKMHHLTPSAFADKIGVQRSNVSHVLSGRNKPSLDFLEKIIIHFPKVNAKWLISGRADVLNDPDDSIVNDSKIESKEVARSESFIVGSKKVVKLIEIYSDGTFREILPTNE
jgi:transcriptional regulator with XRE-family HTH domain